MISANTPVKEKNQKRNSLSAIISKSFSISLSQVILIFAS